MLVVLEVIVLGKRLVVSVVQVEVIAQNKIQVRFLVQCTHTPQVVQSLAKIVKQVITVLTTNPRRNALWECILFRDHRLVRFVPMATFVPDLLC